MPNFSLVFVLSGTPMGQMNMPRQQSSGFSPSFSALIQPRMHGQHQPRQPENNFIILGRDQSVKSMLTTSSTVIEGGMEPYKGLFTLVTGCCNCRSGMGHCKQLQKIGKFYNWQLSIARYSRFSVQCERPLSPNTENIQ